MNISEAERDAIQLLDENNLQLDDASKIKFIIKSKMNNKEMKCNWLDPYMGLFQIENKEGFMMSHDLERWPIEIVEQKVER